MRTLRQFRGHIQAVSLRHAPSMAISIILGAYLSLQLVTPGMMIG